MPLNRFKTVLIFLFALLLCCGGIAHARQNISGEWELHEIEITPAGMLRKSAGDPYIVFPEIEQQ
ncbi:MAG TPA: hypothetical protein ENO25_02590, partial [Desulfobacteraceae bacterium]|nr:hypothetical protein [Desulfobacteraceae bacterium]